jgi:hypothetical protein
LSLTQNELWEADSQVISCGPLPRSAQLAAQVSDPSGVAQVRATWRAGSYNGDRILTGGGLRTATIGPHPYASLPSGTDRIVTVTVVARDGAGNTTSRTIDFRLHSTDKCFG